jgi:hypothetical protein
MLLTIDLERSPRTSHRSAAVWVPTRITANKPTNLTLIAEAIIIPVNTSHAHHLKENALLDKKFNNLLVQLGNFELKDKIKF